MTQQFDALIVGAGRRGLPLLFVSRMQDERWRWWSGICWAEHV